MLEKFEKSKEEISGCLQFQNQNTLSQTVLERAGKNYETVQKVTQILQELNNEGDSELQQFQMLILDAIKQLHLKIETNKDKQYLASSNCTKVLSSIQNIVKTFAESFTSLEETFDETKNSLRYQCNELIFETKDAISEDKLEQFGVNASLIETIIENLKEIDMTSQEKELDDLKNKVLFKVNEQYYENTIQDLK